MSQSTPHMSDEGDVTQAAQPSHRHVPTTHPQPPHSHDSRPEVAMEAVGLVALHLSVLHCGAPHCRVQVLHEDAGHALCLVTCLLSDPVVQVSGRPWRGLQVLGDLGPRCLCMCMWWGEWGLRAKA